jgi:ATP-binding cassette subfamily B protein
MLNEPFEAASLSQPIRGRLQLVDVTFSYPGTDREVLRNLNLTIDPGTRVALVGENGAGKTTIVKLLARLYDPQHGTVSADGIDLRTIRSREWQSHVAVIFQDFARYWLTVRENVGFGSVKNMYDEQRLNLAAQEAGASKMIADLPNGWDSVLGRTFDGGSELSLGQWQRVALARALFSSADILILDEPTASLDAKQEYDLLQRFEELTKGKTTILISHRLSAARLADRVFFLEAGRIVEEGSHDQLMEKDGQYAAMFKRQASNYTNEGAVLRPASQKLAHVP